MIPDRGACPIAYHAPTMRRATRPRRSRAPDDGTGMRGGGGHGRDALVRDALPGRAGGTPGDAPDGRAHGRQPEPRPARDRRVFPVVRPGGRPGRAAAPPRRADRPDPGRRALQRDLSPGRAHRAHDPAPGRADARPARVVRRRPRRPPPARRAGVADLGRRAPPPPRRARDDAAPARGHRAAGRGALGGRLRGDHARSSRSASATPTRSA